MKSNIKVMLLGITLMAFGIYLRCVFIGNIYNSFIEMIWLILPIIGLLISLYGFFGREHHEETTEKVYGLLLEQKENNLEIYSCKKCGKEYKSIYSYCPHCGYKE